MSFVGRVGLVCAASVVVVGTSLASPASANTPEDLQGIGARVNGMGGAGTSLSGDFTATYYNPAALTRCTDDHIAADIRHTMYNLHVRRRGADAPPASVKPLRDLTRVNTGFCFQLPYNLAFGMALGFGLQSPMTLDQAAPSSRPQFAMYGDTLEQLSIALGFAYEPIPELSIGFGGSILVNTDLSFGAYVPVALDSDGDGFSDPLDVQLRQNILPTGAPYAGVHLRPIPELQIGLTYRGEMFLNLDVSATIRASLLSIDVPIPLQVSGIGWYTPHQIAFGVSGNPTSDLTLTADVTYYAWSRLANTYYPFLAISPQAGYDDTIAGSLSFGRMGRPGWRDVWVPRLGGELKLMDSRLAIRGGYSFRPSALPRPGSRTMDVDGMGTIGPNITTLLDSNVHSISMGVGYFFGDRPHERDAAATEAAEPDEPTAPPPTAYVLPYDADGFEVFDVRGAQTSRPRSGGATTRNARGTPAPAPAPTVAPAPAPAPVAVAPVTAPAGTAATPADVDPAADLAAEAGDEDDDLPGITGQIDFYFRANMLQERIDVQKDISYGGSIFELGIQLSLGWY